jgi:hypothetical protein
VSGTTDFVRFPRRPRVTAAFFEPSAGRPAVEEPAELTARLLDEVRERVPPVAAGRRRAPSPAVRPG